jgi:hypothetical protein
LEEIEKSIPSMTCPPEEDLISRLAAEVMRLAAEISAADGLAQVEISDGIESAIRFREISPPENL